MTPKKLGDERLQFHRDRMGDTAHGPTYELLGHIAALTEDIEGPDGLNSHKHRVKMYLAHIRAVETERDERVTNQQWNNAEYARLALVGEVAALRAERAELELRLDAQVTQWIAAKDEANRYRARVEMLRAALTVHEHTMTPKKLTPERLEELIAVLSPKAFQAVKAHIAAVEAEREHQHALKDQCEYDLQAACDERSALRAERDELSAGLAKEQAECRAWAQDASRDALSCRARIEKLRAALDKYTGIHHPECPADRICACGSVARQSLTQDNALVAQMSYQAKSTNSNKLLEARVEKLRAALEHVIIRTSSDGAITSPIAITVSRHALAQDDADAKKS